MGRFFFTICASADTSVGPTLRRAQRASLSHYPGPAQPSLMPRHQYRARTPIEGPDEGICISMPASRGMEWNFQTHWGIYGAWVTQTECINITFLCSWCLSLFGFQGSDKQQWICNTDQYARKSSTEGDGSCPGLLLSGQSQTQTIMEKMLVWHFGISVMLGQTKASSFLIWHFFCHFTWTLQWWLGKGLKILMIMGPKTISLTIWNCGQLCWC